MTAARRRPDCGHDIAAFGSGGGETQWHRKAIMPRSVAWRGAVKQGRHARRCRLFREGGPAPRCKADV